LRNKKITPKVIQYTPKEEEDPAIIDLERAVELRRKNGVDYVVIGTILEAEATSSSSGIDRITVLGQSVGSSVRAVTATITIQGDLVSVKNGKLVESIRTTGNRTESSVSADVSTEWGSVNSDSSADNNTPNAKALRDAVEKLVKETTAML
jgi:curli biogenesis system outer membrane secretion channel CsgG